MFVNKTNNFLNQLEKEYLTVEQIKELEDIKKEIEDFKKRRELMYARKLYYDFYCKNKVGNKEQANLAYEEYVKINIELKNIKGGF